MSERKENHRGGFQPKNISLEKLQRMIDNKLKSMEGMQQNMERLQQLMLSRSDEKYNLIAWHNEWENLFIKMESSKAFIKSLQETILNISKNEHP